MEQGPRTPDQGPRTKRKYTVSDKVRAANRLNLEKARAVGKEVLYRPTEKRRKACRANLLLARQSPNYQPNVRHGLRAVNQRESATRVAPDAGPLSHRSHHQSAFSQTFPTVHFVF